MRAIIGGTGLNQLPGLKIVEERRVGTEYGAPSSPLRRGELNGEELWFLARHGDGHRVPPHRINYRANIAALQSVGVSQVAAVAAVGGISPDYAPATLALTDDIIDYTYGRAHTFSDGRQDSVLHIEMTPPFDGALRSQLGNAAQRAGVDVLDSAVCGVTQGPRLETAAEIRRLRADGCDVVGMTTMPEAALAREAGLAYASLCVVVNWAAGLGSGAIHADLERNVETGMAKVHKVLGAWLASATA